MPFLPVVQKLAKANVIPGFHENGQAQRRRHLYSAFGSGWTGLPQVAESTGALAEKFLAELMGKAPKIAKAVEEMEVVGEEASEFALKEFEAGGGGVGSGTLGVSLEEAARNEVFYKQGGSVYSYLGKQPDASLRAGESVLAYNKITGGVRVVNSMARDEAESMNRFRRDMRQLGIVNRQEMTYGHGVHAAPGSNAPLNQMRNSSRKTSSSI